MLSNMQLWVHHKCEGSREEQTKPRVSCLFCNMATSSVSGNRGIKRRLWDIHVWQYVTVHNKVSIKAVQTWGWWIGQIHKALKAGMPKQWQVTIPFAVQTNILTLCLWELLWQSWSSYMRITWKLLFHTFNSLSTILWSCHFFYSVSKYLMIEIYHKKWLAVPECWPIRALIENVLASKTMNTMCNALEYIRSLLGTVDVQIYKKICLHTHTNNVEVYLSL